MPDRLRRVEFYVAGDGTCDVADALEWLFRSNLRAFRAVQRRIELLQQVDMRQAVEHGIVKKPPGSIFVLRVQSGPVAFRLPFFEAPESSGALVVLTHCEHRSNLRGDRYARLIDEAERRRTDWITRRQRGGENAGG